MQFEENILESGMDNLNNFLFGGSNSTTTQSSSRYVHTTEDPLFQDTFFHPSLIPDNAACKAVLHVEMGGSGVRVWDVLILVPDLVFLTFLFYRFSNTRLRLRSSKSSVERMIYSLTVSQALVSTMRCFLSMILFLSQPDHWISDTLLWTCAHLISLSMEITVAVLSVADKLDTVKHCRMTILVSALVSCLVVSVGLYLELSSPYYGYQVMATGYQLYGAGGPRCEAVTSFVMVLFYVVLMTVRLLLSNKNLNSEDAGRRHNLYLALMITINAVSCLGAALTSVHVNSGLCLSDISRYFYSVFIGPLIYICFIQTHFNSPLDSFQFSYRSQLDEEDEYHEDDVYGNLSSDSVNILRSPVVNEHI